MLSYCIRDDVKDRPSESLMPVRGIADGDADMGHRCVRCPCRLFIESELTQSMLMLPSYEPKPTESTRLIHTVYIC